MNEITPEHLVAPGCLLKMFVALIMFIALMILSTGIVIGIIVMSGF